MIRLLVSLLGPLLKVQPTPPHVPQGAKEVVVFRASERWLAYRYLLAGLRLLPVLLGGVVFAVALSTAAAQGKPAPAGIWAVLVLYVLGTVISAAFGLVGVRLDWEFHCYVMTDRSVRIRHGIWEQVEATLTYANVQNVRVVQGPIERLFGIASVVVDTAGSGGHDARQDPLLQHHRGVIRGIEDAHALRDRIMARLRSSKSSGLGDPDDHRDDAHAPETEAAALAAILEEARGLARELGARKERPPGGMTPGL